MTSQDDLWRALSPHRTHLAGPLVGWRFWHAGGSVLDGHPLQPAKGRRHKACLVDPLLDSSSEESAVVVTGRPLPPAACRRDPHPAPADGCTCGYRIVRELPELMVYLRRLHRVSAPDRDDIPVAVARVHGYRAARHGSESDKKLDVILPAGAPPEPPRTARVECMDIIGPILLAPSITHAAQAFADEFRMQVRTVGGGTIWGWYDGLIAGRIGLI